MQNIIVERALNSMKEKDSDSVPMTEYAQKGHIFEPEARRMVEEAGCTIKWIDTSKGGCYHIVKS